MELFPSILSKYDVKPDLANIDQTFWAIYTLVFKLDTEIKTSENATPSDATAPAYDKTAKADGAAKVLAVEFVAGVLADMAELIEANSNVAYHLADQMKSVSQFLTGEVHYARRVADRALPASKRSDVNDVKRGDRKELIVFLRNLWETFTPLQATADPKNVKDGKLILPSLKGRASSTSETANPTGRYARHYSVQWSVNDELFPIGSDPMLVVRTIWVGSDRIGRKLADLHDPFDKAGGMVMKPGDSVKFMVNGQEVTARMVSSDDED